MPWPGTSTRMTPDGSNDLVLDEGADWGSYEYAAVDLGAIARYHIDLDFRVEESPASDNLAEYDLEIDLSNDGAAWAGYIPYIPGEFSCRHFKLKVTIKTKPWTKQRPKITRMEHCVTRSLANPHFGQVTAQQNNPPATPTMGCRYIVATGGGAWTGHDGELAYCSESTTPTWVFIDPVAGNRAYRVDVGEEWFYDGTEWVRSDPRKQFGNSVHRHAQGYSAINGAAWNYSTDANQDSNGYEETFSVGLGANGDYIEWKFGLLISDYTLVAILCTGPSLGIIDISLDGVIIASWDLYTAGLTNNLRQVVTPISVTGAITHTLRFTMNGQNPLSSGFDMAASWFEMFPA